MLTLVKGSIPFQFLLVYRVLFTCWNLVVCSVDFLAVWILQSLLWWHLPYCSILCISHKLESWSNPGSIVLARLFHKFASLISQLVKNPPAMWETLVQYPGREDPLEKEMATHSGTLTWKIPWMEESDGLQSMGLQRVGHDWATSPLFLNIVMSNFCPFWPPNKF